MAKIDYMKVIGVLSKTLKMETTELNYRDQSIDRLEVTMTGQNREGVKFLVTVSDSFLDLVFPEKFMSDREFNKWRSSFEYELEQAFFTNVVIETRQEATQYQIRVII